MIVFVKVNSEIDTFFCALLLIVNSSHISVHCRVININSHVYYLLGNDPGSPLNGGVMSGH